MKTLLIIDVQNDFLPGGALPVPAGDKVIDVINAIQPNFDRILASKDWHPKGHISFAITHGKKEGEILDVRGKKQVLWPVHCLQNSKGADFPSRLKTNRIEEVFYKGADSQIDSYSAFFDNAHDRSTGLEIYLKENEIEEIYVVGLATDYCVKFSVLDAIELGFKVIVIRDGCRGINLREGDVERAIAEMQKAGATFIESNQLTRLYHL